MNEKCIKYFRLRIFSNRVDKGRPRAEEIACATEFLDLCKQYFLFFRQIRESTKDTF